MHDVVFHDCIVQCWYISVGVIICLVWCLCWCCFDVIQQLLLCVCVGVYVHVQWLQHVGWFVVGH